MARLNVLRDDTFRQPERYGNATEVASACALGLAVAIAHVDVLPLRFHYHLIVQERPQSQ